MPGEGSVFRTYTSRERWRPSATWVNAASGAAQDFLRRSRSLTEAGSRRVQGPYDVVRVYNNSGGNRDKFEVLDITDLHITPTENVGEFKRTVAGSGIVVSGSTPDASTIDNVVVLLEAIRSGAIGRAAIAGVAQVQVNVTDASHAYAQATSGDASKLTSDAEEGFPILWKESGTGTKWALIRLSFRTVTVPAWTQMPYSQDIDDGGTLPLGGGAAIHYTAAVQDGERHAYFTWELDGDNTVAQTFDDDLFLIFNTYHELGNSTGVGSGTVQLSTVKAYVITEQFDWTNLAWGSPPACYCIADLSYLSISGAQNVGDCHGVNWATYATDEYNENIHGLKITVDSVTNPLAGDGEETWSTFCHYSGASRVTPRGFYIEGIEDVSGILPG